MKRLSLIPVMLAAALGSGTASAEDDVLNYAGVLNPSLTSQLAAFGTTKDVTGLFHDTFTFSFSSLAGVNSAGTGVFFLQLSAAAPNVDFTAVSLNGVAGTVYNAGGVSTFEVGPAPGNLGNAPAYTLEVWGTATAGAQYGGQLNVSAVPEPGSYALMLAGLGLVGWVARRRRSH